MTLEDRYSKIKRVLDESPEIWFSATEIAKHYMENPNSSDSLSTGTICNILSFAGVVERTEFYIGKSIRVKYKSILLGSF